MATWVSNGSDIGGSGTYSPGTQGVQYILANFAASGDTITLPAGTFNWGTGTGSTPGTQASTTFPFSVTLQGQPLVGGARGNVPTPGNFPTVIQNQLASGNLINAKSDSSNHIVICNIRFLQVANNTGGAGYCLSLDRSDMNAGQTALVTCAFTCLIHDCYFDSGTLFGYMIHVGCIGIVLYYCTLTNQATASPSLCGITNEPDKYQSTIQWNHADAMGGSATAYGVGDTASGFAGVAGLNNTYIENCFLANGTSTTVDIGANSRVVVRYCVVQDGLISTHGGTGVNAARTVEIYNNTFNNVNGSALGLNNWISSRSGLLLITGNTMQAPPSAKPPFSFLLEQVNRSNFGGSPQTVYPACRQCGYGWSLAQQNVTTVLTGNVSGVNVTALSSTAALVVGQQVSGAGITAGTVIQTIVSTTAITLSTAGTTGTGVSLTFTGIPFGFPPFLGPPSLSPTFGYGQQLDPNYIWSNTGAGIPTASNTYIDQFTPDNNGNNLTVAGTIYFNQQVSTFSSSAVASLAATFPGTQNASVAFPGSFKNDLLLCMLSWSGGGVTLSVTDSTGNNWIQIGTTFSAATNVSQAIFATINSSTTCTATVTAHFVPNVVVVGMNIADYAGNWPSITELNYTLSVPTTDGANQNSNNSSSSLSTGTITTTSQSGGNDLLIAWVESQSTPTGVVSGFYQQAFDATNHFGFFDNIGSGGSAGFLATTGTFGLTATTTAPWTASIVAFQSMPFLLNGRDIVFGTAPSGWTPFTYPHPLTSSVATNGITAAADASITRTIVGATGGYIVPSNNWVALYVTQFGAAKAGATEWSGGSYARQPMGASGVGWTIAAYANGTGVIWKNTNLLSFPAVLTVQTLLSLGFCDALTSGNIDFFIDLSTSLSVPQGISVALPALTGAVFTTY